MRRWGEKTLYLRNVIHVCSGRATEMAPLTL